MDSTGELEEGGVGRLGENKKTVSTWDSVKTMELGEEDKLGQTFNI